MAALLCDSMEEFGITTDDQHGTVLSMLRKLKMIPQSAQNIKPVFCLVERVNEFELLAAFKFYQSQSKFTIDHRKYKYCKSMTENQLTSHAEKNKCNKLIIQG